MALTLTIGVDIGQKADPTSVVVAETTERTRDGRTESVYVVRDLGRLPLGLPYPDVAKRIGDVIDKLLDRDATAWPSLVLDVTGVGRPVYDLIRVALDGWPCSLVPVTFTHGDKLTREGDEWRLGKAFLVSQLQSVLQTQRLQLPKSAETDALTRELMTYEIRVDPDGNDKYGAFSTGSHDDLVTALGLAVVYAEAQSGVTIWFM